MKVPHSFAVPDLPGRIGLWRHQDPDIITNQIINETGAALALSEDDLAELDSIAS